MGRETHAINGLNLDEKIPAEDDLKGLGGRGDSGRSQMSRKCLWTITATQESKYLCAYGKGMDMAIQVRDIFSMHESTSDFDKK